MAKGPKQGGLAFLFSEIECRSLTLQDNINTSFFFFFFYVESSGIEHGTQGFIHSKAQLLRYIVRYIFPGRAAEIGQQALTCLAHG